MKMFKYTVLESNESFCNIILSGDITEGMVFEIPLFPGSQYGPKLSTWLLDYAYNDNGEHPDGRAKGIEHLSKVPDEADKHEVVEAIFKKIRK